MEQGEEHKEEEKSEEKKEVDNKKTDLTKMIRKNPWVLSTIVLGIVVLMFLIGNFSGVSGNVISSTDAGNNLIEYLNSVGYEGFTLNSVEEKNGFYLIDTSYEDSDIPFYVTKTGYIVGNSLVSIIPDKNENSQENSAEISKSDKPIVELFIMTHCPYGTQAEKGFIPSIEALGNTIDSKIRFVHYFMHEPEEEETSRQICIREEQSDKYLNYLECFLEGDGIVDEDYGLIMNGNDPSKCMKKVGIDESKVQSCIDSKKWEEYYEADSKLSKGYGVQGSPTLVINGEIVSSERDSASYLNTICQAFNNAPEECGTQLSSETPSAYFGWDETGSSTTAQC